MGQRGNRTIAITPDNKRIDLNLELYDESNEKDANLLLEPRFDLCRKGGYLRCGWFSNLS
jgi:hypothetical protein